MPRYFVRARHVRADDDDWCPTGNRWHIPTVSDHEATDTGLLDASGETIMRAANPIGFGRDEDW